jgi:branched-chain amino acid transport system permease protein
MQAELGQRLRRREIGITALALVVLLALVYPFIFNDYLVGVGITVLMLGIMAESWNLIGGYAGYPSFGNAVFFGLGAYTVALIVQRAGLPFVVGLLLSGIVTGAAAVLIGIPVLRLRGHYFAIATLGVLSFMEQVVIVSEKLTRGGAGIRLPIPSMALETFNEVIYLLMLLFLLAVTGFTYWTAHSKFGFGLIAIRENEVAARVMGVNTTLYKIAAFAASGFFTGFAGAIFAYWQSYVDPPSVFSFDYNVLLVIMAFVGGAGTVFGPVVGAVLLGVVSEYLRGHLGEKHLLVFGLVIVFTVIFAPNGLMEYLTGRRGLSVGSFLSNIREHRV